MLFSLALRSLASVAVAVLVLLCGKIAIVPLNRSYSLFELDIMCVFVLTRNFNFSVRVPFHASSPSAWNLSQKLLSRLASTTDIKCSWIWRYLSMYIFFILFTLFRLSFILWLLLLLLLFFLFSSFSFHNLISIWPMFLRHRQTLCLLCLSIWNRKTF